jgi:hypothetical protein
VSVLVFWMKIIVAPVNSDPYIVDVDNNGRIADLKRSIYIVNGHAPSLMNIVFRGKILDDETTLIQNKLHDMAKVFLAIKKSKKHIRRTNSAPERSKLFQKDPFTHDQLSDIVETLKKQNPKAQHLFNDADTIEDLFNSTQDPEVNLARQRALDHLMDMDEMQIGGFQSLVHRHNLIENILEQSQESLDRLTIGKTVIPKSPQEPSTKKLPTPYGPEAKLKFLMTTLENIPEDHPNRVLIETFIFLFSKTLELDRRGGEEESGDKPKPPNPFANGGLLFGQEEEHLMKPKHPVFNQIFHPRQQKETQKAPFRRLIPPQKDNFSDSDSDDGMGVD